jgi:class 3 adenylate cyclase
MTFKNDMEREVKKIFATEWTEREWKVVPTPGNLSPDNDAIKLDATVLYADIADSTKLVDRYSLEHYFAAEVYKAYLRCAATIINSEQGDIRGYDGDRVMAVFRGDSKNTSAVRSALKINYAVQEIINPLLKKQYPRKTYQLKHAIGVDTSDLFVARIGVRKDNDLVWVGRAANYAAKLCNWKKVYSIYITGRVYDTMDKSVKVSNRDNSPIWHKDVWTARNNMRIYGSSEWESFT